MGNQSLKILIENLFFNICQPFEFLKNLIQLNIIQLKTKFLDPVRKCMTTRMFAQHQIAGFDPHRLRSHDFVGQGIFQHSVLVDSSFVCKGISTNNRLIRLNTDSRNL